MRQISAFSAVAALVLAWSGSALAQETVAPPAPSASPAQPAPADAAAPATAPAPAAAPSPAAKPAPAPEAKAHMVFFRPWRLPGGVYTYHIVEVAEDGKPAKDAPRLGDLPNGGSFLYDAEAGIHNYNITGPMAVNKAEDRIRIELEPGQTYYVEQTVRLGVVTGGFRLVPADQARFTESHVKPPKP